MKYFESTQSVIIAKNKVFIDGISRTGKSIFSTILPLFEKMEHIQFSDLIEWLVPAAKYGGINVNYLDSILKVYYNQLYYNLFISRNVNFRKNDQTGIDNYRDPKVYYSRLEKNDDEAIIKEINSKEFYVPFMTHDLMVNMDIINQLTLDCKILEIYRDPIDIVYSWWKRGLGNRLGKDPREFTLLLKIKNKELPWYCAEIDNMADSHTDNELDFIIEIVLSLINRSVYHHKNELNNKNIFTITYEEIVQETDNTINNIKSFLGLNPLKVMKDKLKEIGLPKIIKANDRSKKLNIIKNEVSPINCDRLAETSSSYIYNLYGLKSE